MVDDGHTLLVLPSACPVEQKHHEYKATVSIASEHETNIQNFQNSLFLLLVVVCLMQLHPAILLLWSVDR